MDYLKDVKRLHADKIRPYKGKPIGCSRKEVSELEKEIGFELPEAYRQFLLWMGKDYKGIFQGLDCFIDDIIKNTSWLPDLLAENKVEFALPEYYLAFYCGQGYEIAWFNLPKNSEDPIVYYFIESDESGNMDRVKMMGTLTDFLYQYLKCESRVEQEQIATDSQFAVTMDE